ncbi:MAG: hypothetical protein AB1736_04885 [Chloroflexota bacterium]
MSLATALPRPAARRFRRVLAAFFAAAVALAPVALGPVAPSASAAEGVGLEARVLLQGHTRVGSWMAIEVELANDGPAVRGELRLAGGSQGRTRFSVAVDLPTESRKTYVLHAQPPAFGRSVKVELVAGSTTVGSADVAYLAHQADQLIVGVIAERPQGIIGELDLDPSVGGAAPAIVSLGIGDLPERVEGWATLDRLIWQDVHSNLLSDAQLEALRGWVAGGGRLIVAGGTAGIGTLSGFPDDFLPYRPTATLDIAPESIAGLVGPLPADAADLAAYAGEPGAGRPLATSGDRTVAGQLEYGNGSVTILGFDPTTTWLAAGKEVESMWRRFLPARSGTGPLITSDDSQLVNAVNQLASLALPPIGGLIAILGGYVLLIGPINYLVLRRLDRRELAWVTMPVLIAVFAVVAYGFGTALRGTDLILNEVAIVRGAPGATEGTAQVYFGIYSPSRSTYQVRVPGGALLAAPISEFVVGGEQGLLDVVQGDPSIVRDLAVGFSSLRTIRAESATTAPLIEASLKLKDGLLSGTVRNRSDVELERVAVVLGSSVAVIGDIAVGAETEVKLRPSGNAFFESLADRVFGQVFFGDTGSLTDDGLRLRVRHAILSQLSYDPMTGMPTSLGASAPVVLAWGRDAVLGIEVENQTARRTTNVLYYYVVDLEISGQTTFATDLVQATVVSADAAFFGKEFQWLNMGAGTATIAYQPIGFEGSIAPTELQVSLNFGGGSFPSAGAADLRPLEVIPVICKDPAVDDPPGCEQPRFDGLPEVELFDRTGDGAWIRFPHMGQGAVYRIEDPGRYIDPATGQVLVRFVNEQQDSGVGFQFNIAISGVIS